MLRHSLSFILPITVLIVVPYFIENDFRLTGIWSTLSGSIFIGIGLMIIILTFRMFIQIGKGTLAPWDPTKKLIISSLYAYVRNPMILGVLLSLLGEAILFRSTAIGVWAFLFFLINTVYFKLSEEPGLARRFGEEYLLYKENVPMWLPRRKPWKHG